MYGPITQLPHEPEHRAAPVRVLAGAMADHPGRPGDVMAPGAARDDATRPVAGS